MSQPTSTAGAPRACVPLQLMRSQVSHLELLGRGGQAVVLRAVWQLADVAVKLVVANPASTPASTMSKLLLEGPLSKRLRAPNVVETYCYSCTQLTTEALSQCQAADEPPACSTAVSNPSGVLVQEGVIKLVDFLEGTEDPAVGWHWGPHETEGAALRTFDSLDGFGSPSARRSAAAVMTYSDALSRAGAAPGCYLTQIIME
jgi:hypothetical protein